MKSIKLMLLVLTTCVIAFSSCSKKKGPQPGVIAGMSFKFNGALKSTPTVVATYYASVNTLQVVGAISNSENISLQVDSVKVGTFSAAKAGVILSYSPDATFQNTYFGTTGSVTIATYTKTTVTGTFSFTAVNSLNVSATISAGTFAAQIVSM